MTSETKPVLTTLDKNHFHIYIDCDDSLPRTMPDSDAANLLSKEAGLSKQKIKQAMQYGAVWLHRGKHKKRLRKGNTALQKGDKLELYYDEYLFKLTLEPPVLLEDLKDYSIWYKPYGVLSQGTQWGDKHSILRFAELNLKPQRPAFLVHRLDREARGLMLIAHSKSAASKLSQLFATRNVEKHYLAIVSGEFPNQELHVENKIEGKVALSHFKLVEFDSLNKLSLIDASIETGRKHQIRIHLKQAGFPIIGDMLYGDKETKNKRLQLCAISLSFFCPLQQIQKEFVLPDKLRINV